MSDDAVFYMDRECRLTDEELAKRRDEMAKAIEDYRELDDHKRGETARMNRELKGLKAKAEELSQIVLSREETRPVECRRVMDAEHQRVAVLRLDTGQVVDVRDMTPEEVERTQGERDFVPEPDIQSAIEAFAEQMEDFDPDEDGAEPVPVEDDLREALLLVAGFGEAKLQKIIDANLATKESLLVATPDDLVQHAGLAEKLAADVLIAVQTRFGDVPPPDGSVDDILGLGAA